MSGWRVEFTTAAAKEVRKLDPVTRRRILIAVSALERDPRSASAVKLQGYDSAWRLRAGDHRVLYEIDDEIVLITVVRAAHRRHAYD